MLLNLFLVYILGAIVAAIVLKIWLKNPNNIAKLRTKNLDKDGYLPNSTIRQFVPVLGATLWILFLPFIAIDFVNSFRGK